MAGQTVDNPIIQQQLQENPVGKGYNYRLSVPVPKDTAVRAKNEATNADWGSLDHGWGGEHANRYWDGLTKSEIWLGLQKLKYVKDGSWSGHNSDFWDHTTLAGRSTHSGPSGGDSQHPRMANPIRTVGPNNFHKDGLNHLTYSNCHRKLNRFLICGIDLPQKSAWSYCKKEFLDYKQCHSAYRRYVANDTEMLAKQLATFSKGINDEYFDLTSATAFNYGDIHKAHQVGQDELKFSSQDWMMNGFYMNRLY